jgi:excisionase family DNA binding protein
MEKEFFTIKEAAEVLRRHPTTVWRWTLEGKIAFHQPHTGAKILIPMSAIFKALRHPEGKKADKKSQT